MLPRPRTTTSAPLSGTLAADEQFVDAGGRARLEERILPEQELADVDRVKAIDVFAIIDGAENLVLADVARQWRLDEDAVHLGIGVKLLDQREQFRLRRLLLEHNRIGADAQFLGLGALHADVGA